MIDKSINKMIQPIIPIFLMLSAVAAHGAGILDVDIFTSKDVELYMRFGVNNFTIPVHHLSSRHFSFHPSPTSLDDTFPMTVGPANSGENAVDVNFHLVPGVAMEILKFEDVTITIQANYKCDAGMEGPKCAEKIPNYPNPTSTLLEDIEAANTAVPTEDKPNEHNNKVKNSHYMYNICGIMIFAMYCMIVRRIIRIGRYYYMRHGEQLAADNKENLEENVDEKDEKKVLPDPPVYSEIETKDRFPEKTVITIAKDMIV